MAKMADKPRAAKMTWTNAPDQIPNIAEKPEEMPLLAVWPRIKAISGPGDRFNKKAAVKKVAQCVKV
ncbi:hypothetical protein DESC_370018 [Desulfosarcina cetonica]|nr:hypothetical protein DESC_370018 [Desulfosarcina cetonica]